MKNLAHRLKAFIDHTGLSIYTFEQRCNLKKNALWKSINDGSTFGVDRLIAVGQNFPDLNMNWLINNRGEMLVGQASTGIDESIQYQLTELRKEADYLRTKLAEGDREFVKLYQEMKAKEAAWAAEKNTAAGGAPHQLKRS